ncbi:helix-turn-helix domain-containing protein [Kozakia baliensis]|uniref:helix-turn-helix domain-containing protein n=1 Tax=Kozakia baliensis TaxID=153496 RepID=UPI0004964964
MLKTKLISVDEASVLARVAPRTMRRYISENAGPTITRVGGRVFIQEKHLREWLGARVELSPLSAVLPRSFRA